MAVDLNSITGGAGSIIPSKETITSSMGSMMFYLTIFIIVVIFLAIGGVVIWMLIRRWQFNKRIMIFEERGNVTEWIGEDRAKEVTYNVYGDSVFYLQKRKKYLPRGEVKIARNRFIYIIRADGEWVNSSLGSLNSKLRQVGVMPIHPDMRAFKSGMAKIIRDRYDKKNWAKEYLPTIIPIILFIIVAIAFYFIADRLVTSENNLITMTRETKEATIAVLDKAGEVLSAVNNINSGSGIRAG